MESRLSDCVSHPTPSILRPADLSTVLNLSPLTCMISLTGSTVPTSFVPLRYLSFTSGIGILSTWALVGILVFSGIAT